MLTTCPVVKDDRNLIDDYINSNNHEKSLENESMTNELQDKESYLQTKDAEIKALCSNQKDSICSKTTIEIQQHEEV